MVDKPYLTAYTWFINQRKGASAVSEKDKQIMDTFGKVVPHLSEIDKEKLLAFGEGVALMAERQRAQTSGQQSSA